MLNTEDLNKHSFRAVKRVSRKEERVTPKEENILSFPLSGNYQDDLTFLQSFVTSGEEKTVRRKDELREYIDILSHRYNEREVNNYRENIMALFNQINSNIGTIYDKSIQDIDTKKKDIENRVNIRLMDSEFKHKTELKDAITEQENFLRQVNSMTQEMSRIKENYDTIKSKINSFFAQNNELKREIELEEDKHNILEKYLYTYKKVTVAMKNKLPEAVELPRVDSKARLATFSNFQRTTTAGQGHLVETLNSNRSKKSHQKARAEGTLKNVLEVSKRKLRMARKKVENEARSKNQVSQRIIQLLVEMAGGTSPKELERVKKNKRRVFLENIIRDETIKNAVSVDDIKSEVQLRL